MVMSDPSRRPERCPECGYEGPRDGFEGWEGPPPLLFVARCPRCEVVHPDQTNTPIPVDDPPGALRSAWSAPCAQAGCDEVADRIAAQPHGLSMLFKGGAGLLCPTCARRFEVYGAVVLPLAIFVTRADMQSALLAISNGDPWRGKATPAGIADEALGMAAKAGRRDNA